MVKKTDVMSHDPLEDMEVIGDQHSHQISSPVQNHEVDINHAENEPADDSVDLDDHGKIDLDVSLTIAEVSPLYEHMLRIFDKYDKVQLNGDAIEQIDGAGIQLLAAFIKQAVEEHAQVEWIGVSDKLRESAEQLGLTDLLRINAAA